MHSNTTDNLQIHAQTFTDYVGTWTVANARPPADLSECIADIWESGGPVTMGHMKLIPRGTVDFIINLGARQAMYVNGQVQQSSSFQRAWISGLFDHPLFVGPDLRGQSVQNHLVAISFYPDAVLPVFGIPASELVNQVFEADLLLGASVISLQEVMGESTTTEARFQLLLNYIRDLRHRLARPAPFSALWAIRCLQKTAGLTRIEQLCSQLNISRRQLNRQFLAVTGLGPKAFGRLTRFRAAANCLDYSASVDLTELAYRLGYSDQAHFSREFKQFAGESPRQYLHNVGADGEAIFID